VEKIILILNKIKLSKGDLLPLNHVSNKTSGNKIERKQSLLAIDYLKVDRMIEPLLKTLYEYKEGKMNKDLATDMSREFVCVYVVVQFYPCFKFYFPLF